ncbi:DinB family protein [Spirosoma taeanense]|uniref:DinB family protein n=2 Tax=Spirosoma taeanense TaxID=2735870 RepID=A0A6M5YEL0_9BACT|nr:DinB family protein [Spirosoma taeanense]
MKRFSLPFLLFAALTVLSSYRPATTINQMVADWQRAREFTKEYLDAMPEDGVNYKPNPEIRSFAEQMLHLASANFFFVSTATGKANPYAGKSLEKMDDMKTKASLTKAVMESYDFAIDGLKGMNDAQMGEKVKFGNNELSRELAFAKAFEHQTHHRGQTTLYLRMKGIKPPNEKLF